MKVVLLYRRYGDWTPDSWTEAILVDNMNRLLESNDLLDFSTEGAEDDLGYASLHWNVADIEDSRYEVKVQFQCEPLPTPHNEFNFYNTGTVEFVLDKTPPALYGTSQVELHGPIEFVKHYEYTISFTEALYCEMPHVFSLPLTLLHGNDDDKTFSHGSGIYVKCTGEVIKYRFDMNEFDIHASQYSLQTNVTNVTLQLDGVQDIARNLMTRYVSTSVWDRSVSEGTSTSSLSWQGMPAGIYVQPWQLASAEAGANAVRFCA